jgi:hypothetical protein
MSLGMREIADSKDPTGAAKLDEGCMEVFGRPYIKCCNQTIADVAAQGVSSHFDHDGDKCGMHQTDKIPRSMCGDLTRSKNHVVVNPFPEGVALMQKFHRAAVHFSYGTRFKKLMAFGKAVDGGVAKARPKVDLNTTRVMARRMLVHSLVRLNKALELYAVTNNCTWRLSPVDWEVGCEFLKHCDNNNEPKSKEQLESEEEEEVEEQLESDSEEEEGSDESESESDSEEDE